MELLTTVGTPKIHGSLHPRIETAGLNNLRVRLEQAIAGAQSVDVAVAFIKSSGLREALPGRKQSDVQLAPLSIRRSINRLSSTAEMPVDLSACA